MKNLIQNCVIFLFALLTPFLSHSQGCTYEVPLTQQVNSSTQIVEGKVISKTSFWNDARTNIYTVNEVEVFKVFKGSALSTIEVITEGGEVGLEAQIVTPSLELNIGELGVFLLYENNIPLESVGSAYPKFKPYSSVQGFYKYDFFENKVSNPYHRITGITSDFYSRLTELTGGAIEEIQAFSIDEQVEKLSSSSVIVIQSMSPMTITAGTKSILTINGSGFGSEQGRVLWSDADLGGGTSFVYGIDPDIISWSDTKIEVYVVERAGSGRVGVEHANGTDREFSGSMEINIPFAHNNIYTGGFMYGLQLINSSGNGGYAWEMTNQLYTLVPARELFMEALEHWRCETGISWDVWVTNATDQSISDGFNVVRFGVDSELEGLLARTRLSILSCTGSDERFIREMDITFNYNTYWYWGTGNQGVNQIDFKNVAVHELGHAYLLNHVNDTEDVMYNGASNISELGENNLMGAAYVRNKSDNLPICSRPPTEDHPNACEMATATEDVLTNFIEIFPNPVKDMLYINNKSEAELQQIAMYDAAGHQVLVRDIDNNKPSYEINVNELPQGVYFLELTTATGTIVEKIVR